LEEKRKELEDAEQKNIELSKDVKTKDAVLECKKNENFQKIIFFSFKRKSSFRAKKR